MIICIVHVIAVRCVFTTIANQYRLRIVSLDHVAISFVIHRKGPKGL